MQGRRVPGLVAYLHPFRQFLTHFPRSSTVKGSWALLSTDSIDVGNILLVENGRWSIKTKKWGKGVDKTSDLFIGSFDFSLRCISKDSGDGGRRINVYRDRIIQGNETLRFLVVQSDVSEIAHFLLCLIFISTMWFMNKAIGSRKIVLVKMKKNSSKPLEAHTLY